MLLLAHSDADIVVPAGGGVDDAAGVDGVDGVDADACSHLKANLFEFYLSSLFRRMVVELLEGLLGVQSLTCWMVQVHESLAKLVHLRITVLSCEVYKV